MANKPSAPNSLKDYLKKYMSNDSNEIKKKKKQKSKPDIAGVLVVDEDPIWQKPVNLNDEEEDSPDEEKPQLDEDIDVKRLRRLELLRYKRPLGTVSDDGSGWVSISTVPNRFKSEEQESKMHLLEKKKLWNDSHSLEGGLDSGADLSPPRHLHKRSPQVGFGSKNDQTACYDTPSEASDSGAKDLSLPRRKQSEQISHSEPERLPLRSIPSDSDISPPRRTRHDCGLQNDSHFSLSADLSPPRKVKSNKATAMNSVDYYKVHDSGLALSNSDLSPPRKKMGSTQQLPGQRIGLVSAEAIKEEIRRKKKEDFVRFKEMDPSISGRKAAPVYRDKATGERMTKQEFLNSQKKELNKEAPPKEVKLEWGKGLAQKREAEARIHDMESEKNKPFARSRDDPDLDEMLKERVRWGDPMAHLVKKKHPKHDLPDLGDNEKMKESGFIIPQEIPSHSWIRRGVEAATNRYGIQPGRHWDGVDRSNGYEKELFKRMNERRATEQEAYLWSVADM